MAFVSLVERMFCTVQYRGKPLTLELHERFEDFDTTSFLDTDGYESLVALQWVEGRILGTLPDGARPGETIRIRSRGLCGQFRVLDKQGSIKSDGGFKLPAETVSA